MATGSASAAGTGVESLTNVKFMTPNPSGELSTDSVPAVCPARWWIRSTANATAGVSRPMASVKGGTSAPSQVDPRQRDGTTACCAVIRVATQSPPMVPRGGSLGSKGGGSGTAPASS